MGNFCYFRISAQGKQSPNARKFALHIWVTLAAKREARVTRWDFEKIAQNVAQPFLSKLMQNLNHGNI
jgi:DNA-binding IscR family transcriptional regulator